MKPNVVVIGAGLSGLRCASVLQRSGAFDVVVVEAGDRVGGRVRTELIDGSIVEAGAQWVHGTEGNPLVELLELRGSVPPGGRPVIARPATGETISSHTFRKAWTWTSRMLGDVSGPAGSSVGGIVRAKSRAFDPEFRDLCEHRLRFERLISACADVDELDAGAWHEYEERDGPDVRPVRFDDAANRIASRFERDGGRIKLGTRVVSAKPFDGVVADDGAFFPADHVVIAVSLGALQRRTIDVAMDDATRAAIDRLGFGVVEKLMLSFDSEWWREHGQGGQWHSIGGTTAFEDSVTTWRHDPSIDGRPTLIAWLAGPRVHEIAELSDDAVVEQAVAHLRSLSGVDPPPATLRLRTRWGDAPSYGSYSFVKTGASGDDIDALASVPARTPGISMVGEHTHRTRYSTADGALLSGERAAHRLVAHALEPPYACAILEREDGALLAEVRASRGLTCFGGKREPGETARDCLFRELREELGWVPSCEPREVCTLHVNGVYIAMFFAAPCTDEDVAAMTTESTEVSAVFKRMQDPTWTAWHAAVLKAVFLTNTSYATIEDDTDAIALLRKLPTSDDYTDITR